MKRTISTLIALAMLPSLARAQQDADNYPVNYAKCDFIVTEPEGSGGYLHSLDCKTVYVLPSRIGTFKTNVSLNETVLKSVCPTLENYLHTFDQDSTQIRELQERINALEIRGGNQKEIERLQAIAERLNTKLAAFKDPFRNVDGGKASFVMHADTTQSMVQKYYQLNQNLVYSKQVKFEAIPIQIGYLALTNYKPLDKTQFPSTLAVHMNLPQVHGQSKEIEPEGEAQNLFKMKSSGSGQIVLGTSKACELYKRKQESIVKNQPLTPEQLGKELITEVAPTFSYTYPVMSMVKYEAAINTERATELLLDTTKTKSQFRVSEFSQMLGEGTASDIFTMTIDLGDLGERFTNETDRKAFLSALTADVRGRLAEKLLRELELVSLVKYEREPNEVPAPGYITEPIGTVRSCSSSSFFGVTYNSSCHDRVVTRTVPVDGVLAEAIKKVQDFKIKIEERVSIKELIPHGDNVVFE